MDRPGRLLPNSSRLLPAQQALAEAMTELAWVCDPAGAMLWCNRAFDESFGDDAAAHAFLARWREGGGREGGGREAANEPAAECRALVPAWLRDERPGWFKTRAQPLSATGETLTLGLAIDVTVQIDSGLEFARLGPLRETSGPQVLALERVLDGMLGRIKAMLAHAPAPELRRLGDEPILVRCDPVLLERALLDAALACAALPGAGRLVAELSSRPATGQAALTLSREQDTPASDGSHWGGESALPMVRALLRATGGGAEMGQPTESGLRLLLPLHRTQAAAPQPPAARILVVDDEAVVRMLVVDLLRERGHTVQEAEDAFAAMALVQGDAALDLMITDIGLPGGFDGSTLARRARLLRPGLPVLFITGYAFGTNNDVILEPGIPVLTKPFTLRALSSRIADLLVPSAA